MSEVLAEMLALILKSVYSTRVVEGGGRPRTSRPQASGSAALFGRLRRLEVLLVDYIDPRKGGLTTGEIVSMIQAIRDCHAGKRFDNGEVVDVPEGRQSAKNSRGNRRGWSKREGLTATLGEVAETHDPEDEEQT